MNYIKILMSCNKTPMNCEKVLMRCKKIHYNKLNKSIMNYTFIFNVPMSFIEWQQSLIWSMTIDLQWIATKLLWLVLACLNIQQTNAQIFNIFDLRPITNIIIPCPNEALCIRGLWHLGVWLHQNLFRRDKKIVHRKRAFPNPPQQSFDVIETS
jgi:hypothetical protein